MHRLIADGLAQFAPVSLAELNTKAAMMERLDQKYVVPADRLAAAFAIFAPGFDVLEIGGQRSFHYATRYFDSPDVRSYHDHHQGRRKRCKVRIRHYVDAGLTYLEVKLKDRREVTVKKRIRLDRPTDHLSAESRDFVEAEWQALYGEPFGLALAPALAMDYERITLVAREGGERMTVDTGLVFHGTGRSQSVAPDLFILETKSARGRGLADTVLRGQHLHPTRRLSKYCVGMASLGRVERRNRFLPALRRLFPVSPNAEAA